MNGCYTTTGIMHILQVPDRVPLFILYLFYESVKYYALFSFFDITFCTCFPISSHQTVVNVFNKIMFVFMCAFTFLVVAVNLQRFVYCDCVWRIEKQQQLQVHYYLFVTSVDKMLMFLLPYTVEGMSQLFQVISIFSAVSNNQLKGKKGTLGSITPFVLCYPNLCVIRVILSVLFFVLIMMLSKLYICLKSVWLPNVTCHHHTLRPSCTIVVAC